jgi:hypothetical protein
MRKRHTEMFPQLTIVLRRLANSGFNHIWGLIFKDYLSNNDGLIFGSFGPRLEPGTVRESAL